MTIFPEGELTLEAQLTVFWMSLACSTGAVWRGPLSHFTQSLCSSAFGHGCSHPRETFLKEGRFLLLLFVISKGWVLIGLTSLLEGGIPQPDGSSTWGRLQRGLWVSPAPRYSIFSPSLGDKSPFLINVTPKHISLDHSFTSLTPPLPQRGHIYSIMLTTSSLAPRVSLHCLNRSNIIWSPTFQLSSRG